MSRRRGSLAIRTGRLKNNKLSFQASDLEIEADLKKMKYINKIEPQAQLEKKINVKVPRKRKISLEDDRSGIDGLIKLMKTKSPDREKIQTAESVIETKNHLCANQPSVASLAEIQRSLLMNNIYMSQFNFMNFPYYQIRSYADFHVRAARFIQYHKRNSVNLHESL